MSSESQSNEAAGAASNPFRPDESEAPPADDGEKHVRFSAAEPAIADVAFMPSPPRVTKHRRRQPQPQPVTTRKLSNASAATNGSQQRGAVAEDPPAADAAKATQEESEAPKEAAQDGTAEAGESSNADGAESEDHSDTVSDTSSEEEGATDDLDVCERLFVEGQRHNRRADRARRRHAQEQRRAERQLIAEAGFKPKISEAAMAKKKQSTFSWRKFVSDQADFKTRTEKKLREKEREQVKKEREPNDPPMVTGRDGKRKPYVPYVSDALIAAMKEDGTYVGPVRGWHRRFADYLVKRSGSPPVQGAADKSGFSRHTARSSPSPQRRSASASMGAREKAEESHVFDRLYNQAETRRAAQELMAAAHQEAEHSTLFQPLTNHRMSRIHSQAQESMRREASRMSHSVGTGHEDRQSLILRAMGAAPSGEESGAFGTWQETTVDFDTRGGDGDEGTASTRGGDEEVYIELDNDDYIQAGDPSPPRRPDEVVAALVEKGEEYRERAQKRREDAQARSLDGCTFKPQTNQESKRILQRVAEKVVSGAGYAPRQRGVDVEADAEFEAAVRGAAPVHILRRSEADMIRAAGGSSPMRSGPAYNPTPRTARSAGGRSAPGQRKFDVDLFTARSRRRQAEREEKLQQLKAERERGNQSECTFRPRISEVSRELSQRGEPKLATSPHYNAARTGLAPSGVPAAADSVSYSPKARTPPATARAVPRAAPQPQAQRQLADDFARARGTPSSVPVLSEVPKRSPAASVASSAAGTSRRHRQPSPTASTPRGMGAPKSSGATTVGDDDTAGLDDGMAYLEALEKELQGVLDEWRAV